MKRAIHLKSKQLNQETLEYCRIQKHALCLARIEYR